MATRSRRTDVRKDGIDSSIIEEVKDKVIAELGDITGGIAGPAGPAGPTGPTGPAGEDGKGFTGGSYNAALGVVAFLSDDDGLAFTTGDLRGADGNGLTSASYNPATGEVTFLGGGSFNFTTGDLRGANGLQGPAGPGFTSGSYNADTGQVTFVGNGELGFTTGDLRGADGAPGEDGQDAESPIAKTFSITAQSNKFLIDGQETPSLTLFRGQIYKFDYSSASGHPFVLQTNNTGTYNSDTVITDGWSVENNIATYEVPQDAPQDLYYVCSNHANMGGSVALYNLIPSELKGADGADGVSPTASQVATELVASHLTTIKGDDGADGADADPAAVANTLKQDSAFVEDVAQNLVSDHSSSLQGSPGSNGQDGESIASVALNGSDLVFTLTDGGQLPAVGPVIGADGADGTAVKYLLRVAYSNIMMPYGDSESDSNLKPQFLPLDNFLTSGASLTTTIDGNVPDNNHYIDLSFSNESSPPLSIVSYVPDFAGPNNIGKYAIYPLTANNRTVKINIDASSASDANYSSMFTSFNNISIRIPINRSSLGATYAPAQTTHYAFFIISF